MKRVHFLAENAMKEDVCPVFFCPGGCDTIEQSAAPAQCGREKEWEP